VTVQPEKIAKSSIKGEIAQFKRKQILDAAVELFLRNGYHGTSVDAIAAVLGVSKQFVYYQFKDKAAILDGVCTTGAELTLSAITNSDELVGSTVDKMRVFCRSLTEIVIDHGKYLAVYASEVSTLRDEDRKRTLAIRAEVDDRVSELIDRGMRGRSIRRRGSAHCRSRNHRNDLIHVDLGTSRRPRQPRWTHRADDADRPPGAGSQ